MRYGNTDYRTILQLRIFKTDSGRVLQSPEILAERKGESMKESRTTSKVTELPASCKSAMEHMEQELKKEEEGQSCEYRIADLPESCKKSRFMSSSGN